MYGRANTRHVRRLIVALGAAAVLACGCTSAPRQDARHFRGTPPIYDNPHIDSVAVLGFGNEAITEQLTANLARCSRWRVLERTQVERFLSERDLSEATRFEEMDPVRLAQQLEVDMVVFGKHDGGTLDVWAIGAPGGPRDRTMLRFDDTFGYAYRPEDATFFAHAATTLFLPYTMNYDAASGRWMIWFGDVRDTARQMRVQSRPRR